MRVLEAPSDFADWSAILLLLQSAFAYMDGRIDPPSSLGGYALMKSESLLLGLSAVVAGVLIMGVLHTFLVPLVRSEA